MQIGILGINHKLADLKLREKLAKICDRKFKSDSSIHEGHFFVLLSTCNRTEIYFSSHDLAETHTYILNILRHEIHTDFEQKLYSYFGYDCFLHLVRVTAGLDSALLFETEIQGQVKCAYESTKQITFLPKELHFLFQKALKVGKKIRFESPLERKPLSLEHALFKTGEKLFNTVKDKKILIIGASEINEKVLSYLQFKNCKNISICNRTNITAELFAKKYHLNQLLWEEMHLWHLFDWIILGTKSPNYLIKNSLLLNSINKHKLIIDLSVPRNVDPEIAFHDHVTLFNIDEINRLLSDHSENISKALLQTEELIAKETKQHICCFKAKEQYTLLHITA